MSSVTVELERLNPDAKTPSCALFRHIGYTSITGAIALYRTSVTSTFINLQTGFTSPIRWNTFFDSYSVVCALHPQTRLNTVYFAEVVDKLP